MKTVSARIITGLVLAAVVLACVWGGGGYTAALLWLALNSGLYEWKQLGKHSGLKLPGFWLYLLANVLYFGWVGKIYTLHGTGKIRPVAADVLLWCGVLLCAIYFMTCFFGRHNKHTARKMCAVAAGCVYIAAPLALLNYLAAPFHEDGAAVLTGFFLIVCLNDVFAYTVGSLAGKHKLYEKISPGKTWEGTAGGVLLSGVCGVLWGKFMLPHTDAALWYTLCAVLPVAGVLGDLTESKLKRDAGVKDSGGIFPGHGGVLDRMDSILTAAPAAVALWKLFALLG